MADNRCPLCGSLNFYLKNPDDEYETYEFEYKAGEICFDSDVNESELPAIREETEVFCNKCAWHDKIQQLKKNGS